MVAGPCAHVTKQNTTVAAAITNKSRLPACCAVITLIDAKKSARRCGVVSLLQNLRRSRGRRSKPFHRRDAESAKKIKIFKRRVRREIQGFLCSLRSRRLGGERF